MSTNEFHDQSVTAAAANRGFSRLLREVREGQRFVVTSHGRPIARLVPYKPETRSLQAARAALLDRLEGQATRDIGPWTRDELYDR
ncbi:MAG: type II toxin-antitoxin system prevent-host-death family antitoxin [Caulobacteraceae bacterium]